MFSTHYEKINRIKLYPSYNYSIPKTNVNNFLLKTNEIFQVIKLK